VNKKNIIFLIIICLVFFITGFLVSQILNKAVLVEVKKELSSCRSALDVAFPPLSEEIYNLSGVVMEKHDNFIVVQATLQTSRFFVSGEEDFEIKNIKVNLTEETKFFRNEERQDLIEQELSEEIIEPFQRIYLTFDDIKLNQLVGVSSKENIKNKQEFIASEIEVF
jgi:hypothetical protein